jgi:hypothetical protein
VWRKTVRLIHTANPITAGDKFQTKYQTARKQLRLKGRTKNRKETCYEEKYKNRRIQKDYLIIFGAMFCG